MSGSSLDRVLGLDSLARVELLLRVERAFGVRLAEDTLAIVETPHELLTALRAETKISGAGPSFAARATPREAIQGAPDEATTSVSTAMVGAIGLMLAGTAILTFLGITVRDIVIAGGILLCVLAMGDLLGSRRYLGMRSMPRRIDPARRQSK